MVNGYNPFIKKGYFEEIFRFFESINQGVLNAQQIENLCSRGVSYVIVYSMLFPEKVSPFPVSHTLNNLKSSPFLNLLASDDGMYIFAIRSNSILTNLTSGTPFYTPSRMWEAERISKSFAIQKDENCSGGAFACLNNSSHYLHTTYQRFLSDELVYWTVRVKGKGLLKAYEIGEGETNNITLIGINKNEWHWIKIKPACDKQYKMRSLKLDLIEGEVFMDIVALRADLFENPELSESITFPPSALLCNGYVFFGNNGEATFLPQYGANHIALKGPFLSFKPGNYTVKVISYSEAGVLEFYIPDQVACSASTNMIFKDACSFPLHIKANTPLEFAVRYYGKEKAIIKEISFIREHE
jgi:hypothetical protein